MSSRQTRLRELLLLGGLCGFFFFFRLSGFGLLGPDEPRYAQVAREMLARRDWVTPVLYHHTWLEKPILLYWGEMLSYLLLGVSDWAARVPSACAATLLVAGTFLAVRRLRYPARLDAALMVASSALVLGFARAAATDMLLAAPWCLSMLAWFCWYRSCWEGTERVAHIRHPLAGAEPVLDIEGGPHLQVPHICPPLADVGSGSGRFGRVYLYLFYVLNALAMLAKGPVAPVLAAAVVVAFCAVQRNLRALLRTLDPAGLALFFAVAAPWYVLVQLRNPEFFRIFFLQHNLARFGSNLYRHRQPFWYYLPVALAATLPWTIWLLDGLADAFAALRSGLRNPKQSSLGAPSASASSTSPGTEEPPFTFELFLLLWALVPMAFFSLSRSKLPGYILPSIPALPILAAVAVHRRAAREERPRGAAVATHGILLGALAAGVCLAPRLALKLPLSASLLALAAAAAAAIFLLTALPLFLAGWRYLHFVTLVPAVLAVGFILRGLSPLVDATQSARPVAELLQQVATPQALPLDGSPAPPPGPEILQHVYRPETLPVATFGLGRNQAFGLAFYLDHRVDPYEGLEISPAVYELPPAVPSAAHLLVAREGSLPALHLLLGERRLELLASYAPQHIEVFCVSPVEFPAAVCNSGGILAPNP